ncbi:hypothetical protein ACFVBP_10315 [Nocardioides sp. NPDC057764]|uniref:hypothetical protein n=1 Tax=Nocardioides sp. NPDC057764 TaxID=3346243 RepID=UPI00366EBCC3
MSIRTRIQDVLTEAAKIDEAWVRADQEGGGCPSPKAWENDDDARRALSYDAIGVLRDLLTLVDKGEPLDLATPAGELIFMVWDSEEPYEDSDLLLDPGEIYTVCPSCHTVGGEIAELDRAERWNRAELAVQPDLISNYGPQGGEWKYLGEIPNPLAGLPLLAILQGDGDFHTTGHACGACETEVSLPDWVESTWS